MSVKYMSISMREETLYRNIFKTNQLFFLDFSKYNIFKKTKIKNLQDLIDTHYYVELFSSQRTGWSYQIRSFREFDAEHWYQYVLKCPICNQNVFRITDKEIAICKSNHRVQVNELFPKFLRTAGTNK